MNSVPNNEQRLRRLERRAESLSESALVQGRLQWHTDRTVSFLAEDLHELTDRLGLLTGIVETLAGKVDKLADNQQVLFGGLEGLTQRLDRLEALIERYIQGRNGHGGAPS